VKVVSKLADIEFQVGTVRREGNELVVANPPGHGIATQVYVRPSDVLEVLKAVLLSRAGLVFVLAFPLFWWRARKESRNSTSNRAGPGGNASLNKPW
jgi:hypothetical protein